MPSLRGAPHYFAAAVGVLYLLLASDRSAGAHPVPRESHDRVIEVRLTAEAVVVKYHLEVDPWTIEKVDLPPFDEQVKLAQPATPRQLFAVFMRIYAPILADNLIATLDGKPLTFRCTEQTFEVRDSVQCDYEFRADWRPDPGQRHRFRFREGNYLTQSGQIALSLTCSPAVSILEKEEPDELLKAKSIAEWKPGDEERLRRASATFEVIGSDSGDTPAGKSNAGSPSYLLALLDSEQGLLVLLLLAAVFGAAHALTPGHGKTLVAAYLVGERGTVWHALFLGLVTTLTHTGAVILIALVLRWFLQPETVQTVLMLGGGLLVAGFGIWLLLRRLSGGPDHVHLPGIGHHHHHGPGADHDHDGHGNVILRRSAPVGWWGLIVLGVAGGIVPCWDAIVLLVLSISTQQFWLALPLVLAFSAGLACVLILIGVLVVCVKGFADSHWGQGRLIRALPVVSAVFITAMGLWLCYDGVQASRAMAPAAVRSAP